MYGINDPHIHLKLNQAHEVFSITVGSLSFALSLRFQNLSSILCFYQLQHIDSSYQKWQSMEKEIPK